MLEKEIEELKAGLDEQAKVQKEYEASKRQLKDNKKELTK